MAISFTPYQFASYDDEGKVCASAYVLEKGDYRFHVGVNVRDTTAWAATTSISASSTILPPSSRRTTASTCARTA